MNRSDQKESQKFSHWRENCVCQRECFNFAIEYIREKQFFFSRETVGSFPDIECFEQNISESNFPLQKSLTLLLISSNLSTNK